MSDLSPRFQSHTGACRSIVDAALREMQEQRTMAQVGNVIHVMNRRMRDMNCLPLHETADGPHVADRHRLDQFIIEKAVRDIADAPSGCRVDQVLRDLKICKGQIGARMTDDQKNSLVGATKERTDRGMAETDPSGPYHNMWKGWQESCLRSLGVRIIEPEPPLSLAA